MHGLREQVGADRGDLPVQAVRVCVSVTPAPEAEGSASLGLRTMVQPTSMAGKTLAA